MSDPPAPSRELVLAFADVEPWGYGEDLESPIGVYGIGLAVPALALIVLGVRWRRFRARAAQAERAEAVAAAAPTLMPGPQVLRGKVGATDGGGPAVRVTIEQSGSESKDKNGWKVSWVEIDRKIETSPFDLVLADGRHVRVEPDAKVRLVDALDSWARPDVSTRVATASLDPGEDVFVSGELVSVASAQGGYRGGAGLVLRPGRAEPMLLSTEGLATAARSNAHLYAKRARWVVFAALAVQLLALPFHVAVWLGAPQVATIEKAWAVTLPPTKKRKRVAYDYFVRYRLATGEVLEDELSPDDFAKIREGQGVPVHVSPLETTIGPHPTLDGRLAVFPEGALVLLCGAMVVLGRPKGWYEGSTSERVSGRLRDDTP